MFQHDEAAVAAYDEVKEQMSSNWYFLFEALCAHRKLRDHKSSLEYTSKLKSMSEDSKDGEREKLLLDHALLPEVHDCMQLEDFDSAVALCHDLLHKDFSNKLIRDRANETTLGRLFECWYRLGQHEAIVDHMEAWQNLTDEECGLSYWFSFIADNYSIRNYIIAAAKATQSTSRVLSLVLQVREATASDSFRGALRYFEGNLLVYGSHSNTEHDQGMTMWEEMIQTRTRTSFTGWIFEYTVHELAKVLLRKAIVFEPGPVAYSTANNYSNRLRKLCRKNFANCNYLDNPRICLIRLHTVRKEIDTARREAKERLCSVFNDWPNDPHDESFVERFLGLAKTLTVLNDDQNAVAAWQTTIPWTETFEFEATSIKASSAETTPEMLLGFKCESCQLWQKNYVDSWVCRQCPDIMFCASCYQKLREGKLPPTICDKDHEMLYCPPVLESWKDVPHDQILVGGQTRSKGAWIDEIREKYEVQQEQIEIWKLKKVTAFAYRWLRRLRKKHVVK